MDGWMEETDDTELGFSTLFLVQESGCACTMNMQHALDKKNLEEESEQRRRRKQKNHEEEKKTGKGRARRR